MHKRQAIRDEAAAAIAGLTTTGSRVFTSRFFPLTQAQFPCWVVSTDGEEEVEADSMGGGQARELDLIFTGMARATTGDVLEDTLDTMAEELEQAVMRSAFTELDNLELVSTAFDVAVDETDQALGAIVVTYVATYFTTMGAPSA